jgi:Immunity protein 52
MKEYFDYSIRSAPSGQAESSSTLGTRFLNSLDTLNRIDPTLFTNWEIMDFPASASIPLAAARPRIDAIVEANITRGDRGQPLPNYGYSCVAFTDNAAKSRNTTLSVKAGGKDEGHISLETGSYKVAPDPSILTYSFFRAVLLAINATWSPPWSCAQAFRVGYYKVPLFPGAPLFPYSRFHIPWIGYLSSQLAADIGLPPEILRENTPSGGLLMTATKDRLDPTNPEHLRRARILAETLIARTGYSSS